MVDKLRSKGEAAALALLPNPNAINETPTETNTITEKHDDVITQADTQAQVFNDNETYIETNVDTVAINEFKALAKSKTEKKTLEQSKKRATYWLDPKIIGMIEIMSQETGVQKYAVVELAVKELYRQVIKK